MRKVYIVLGEELCLEKVEIDVQAIAERTSEFVDFK
jgi:hypothetical protein